ncbi:hypothetical protein Tsubulata_009747 [Turnera subulata]|uniref:Aldose 1-epimerase n=1 Tax=Turnera subulata TaxID=218843 RepID=A0A9Q0F2Q4_9ROSI|nr:hypothetical protein Tsubulata_009747 [Turnera subulata]
MLCLICSFAFTLTGKLADVALGYDTIKEYLCQSAGAGLPAYAGFLCKCSLIGANPGMIIAFASSKGWIATLVNDTSSFGATVGRVANRIGGAQFTLNGVHYKLPANDGKNMLHGGPKGFSKVIWKVKKYRPRGYVPSIVFTYHSPDGDQGFPGDLLATVKYSLFGENKFVITMKGKALNKATPVNLANHLYWNLGGQDSGDILSEEMQIFASKYTPVDSELIPTGAIVPVKGTPYDFLKPKTIGSRINKLPNGYDINYALDGIGYGKLLKKAAIVHNKKSGRVLELFTNQPGVQLYTSNKLTQKGKGGFVYKPHAAWCLETQGFPDSVNHPNFPSQIVNPGETYKHYMLIKFSTL